MANKRQLKKAIQNACGEMAGECFIAQEMLADESTQQQWNDIILDIATLQANSVRSVGRRFNKADAKKLIEEFRTEAEKIVSRMNDLLPKKS